VTKEISIVLARKAVRRVAPDGENGPRFEIVRPYFGPITAMQKKSPDIDVE
jgi:hypothetical protein